MRRLYVPAERWKFKVKAGVPPHFSLEKARFAQKIIAERVVEEDRVEWPVQRAAGVDVAFSGECSIGAAAVVDYPGLELREKSSYALRTKFPYIPTLLAFREMAPAYLALRRLKSSYQLLFVDGNGRLHPYLAGFACQLGVTLGMPTVGVAKKLLVGEVGEWQDDWAPVIYKNRVIGAAVATRKGAKPIYVSVGHMVSLRTAIRLVKAFTRRGLKLPEPIRQAHIAANEAKRLLKSGKLRCV